jgi:hypothetical protein
MSAGQPQSSPTEAVLTVTAGNRPVRVAAGTSGTGSPQPGRTPLVTGRATPADRGS